MKLCCAMMILFSVSTALRAADPAASAGDPAERIDFIQNALDGGDFRATLWWWGWLGIYGASTGASFYTAATTDNGGTKIIQNVYGVQSALGVAGILISRFASIYGAGELRAMPSGTADERAAKLARGEGLLGSASEDEEFGRSWIGHALGVVVNGGGALVIWKGYDERLRREGKEPGKEALMCFALGMIVSEIQIFTQPMRAVDDWSEYRSRYRRASRDKADESPRIIFAALPGQVVFGVALPF
ncbi:MAG: hypothetical protein EPN93_17200 [Spirochaetes bacterium]|nr:MAG: hypothetical protein EPN93_17200 [Spirochaetota bacterium]